VGVPHSSRLVELICEVDCADAHKGLRAYVVFSTSGSFLALSNSALVGRYKRNISSNCRAGSVGMKFDSLPVGASGRDRDQQIDDLGLASKGGPRQLLRAIAARSENS
jgi:hypothetical protein